jgi:hypothetical protein
MISDLYIVCNTVNRYALRIVTINMIFIGMSDSLMLLFIKKIKKIKMLWTWGEGASFPSTGADTCLQLAVNMEDWHINESVDPHE